jgi:hypothetical protein
MLSLLITELDITKYQDFTLPWLFICRTEYELTMSTDIPFSEGLTQEKSELDFEYEE